MHREPDNENERVTLGENGGSGKRQVDAGAGVPAPTDDNELAGRTHNSTVLQAPEPPQRSRFDGWVAADDRRSNALATAMSLVGLVVCVAFLRSNPDGWPLLWFLWLLIAVAIAEPAHEALHAIGFLIGGASLKGSRLVLRDPSAEVKRPRPTGGLSSDGLTLRFSYALGRVWMGPLRYSLMLALPLLLPLAGVVAALFGFMPLLVWTLMAGQAGADGIELVQLVRARREGPAVFHSGVHGRAAGFYVARPLKE